MPDLETQIREYMESVVERSDPLVAPVRLPQAADSDTLLVESRRPSPGWVIAVAAAVIILLLVGGSGVLFNVLSPSSPADSETPTTAPRPTETTVAAVPTTTNQVSDDEAPSFVEGLGTLRWERIDGDASSLPANILSNPAGGFISYDEGTVWTSDDGSEWTAEALPAPLGNYRWVRVEGDWALGSGLQDQTLYRASGEGWVEMELSPAPLPDTKGLSWQTSLEIPVAVGNALLIEGSRSGWVDWGPIYGTFEVSWCDSEPCYRPPWSEWDPSLQAFRIVHPEDGTPLAELSARVEGNTIRFVDVVGGTTIHIVEGTSSLTANEILNRLTAGGLTLAGGWVSSDGGSWEWTDLPWIERTQVMESPDGQLVAIEISYERTPLEGTRPVSATVWKSTDGATWINHGQPSFFDESARHLYIRESGTLLRANVITGWDAVSGIEESDTWESTDGLAWTRVETPLLPFSDFHIADFGEVVTALPQSRYEFWVSIDGRTWQQVAGTSGINEPAGAGFSSAGATGDILWVVVANDAGPRTLWIGRFEQ